MKNFLRLALTFLIALLGLEASIAQIGKESLPDMDPAVFKSTLTNSLKGNVKGYAYYLTKDGNYVISDAGGVARTAEDNKGKVLPYTIETQQEIASVSKVITGIALLRALEKRGVSVNSSIGPWLPKGWNPNPTFTALTFRQLLSHMTGLRKDPKVVSTSYEDAMEQYAKKTLDPAMQTASYLNLNYQIIRVLLPKLVDTNYTDQDKSWAAMLKAHLISRDNYNAFLSEKGSAIYRHYVTQNLFLPCGITTPTCNPVGLANLAWAYETKDSKNGAEGVDHSLYCSSGFWQMSAKDYAVFITKAMYSEDIISNSSKAIINNAANADAVGWNHKLQRNNGYNYGHGGDINWGLSEVHSYVLYMPGNYVAYVQVNSGELTGINLRGLLYQAFDASRVFPYNCYSSGGKYQFPNASNAGHITKVGLGKLQQTSGKSTGYVFFNNYVTSLKQDSSYTLTLKSGFVTKEGKVFWSVWIDYNQDGVFNSGERIFAKASTAGVQEVGKVTIPASSLRGITRMRVALKRDDTETIANACSSFAFGEVEDYFIDITKPCGIISNLKAVNISSTGASLLFDKPVDNIGYYALRYEESGSGVLKTVYPGETANATVTYILTGLKPNTSYRWAVRSNCGDYGAFTNFKTGDVNICGTDSYESNQNIMSATTIKLGDVRTALICSYTSTPDQDWFKFYVSSNTAIGTKVKIDLTSLPADYDLYLYSGDPEPIASSLKRGTISETISKTLSTGTYYIKVAGYAGAKQNHQYYQLGVKIDDAIASLRQSESDDKNDNQAQVTVYPNPVSNENLKIDFAGKWPQEIEPQVRLFKKMGNEIAIQFSTIAEEGLILIDTKALEKGVYTLRIVLGEHNITKKVVVQ